MRRKEERKRKDLTNTAYSIDFSKTCGLVMTIRDKATSIVHEAVDAKTLLFTPEHLDWLYLYRKD